LGDMQGRQQEEKQPQERLSKPEGHAGWKIVIDAMDIGASFASIFRL
jgi:hypothetical protein